MISKPYCWVPCGIQGTTCVNVLNSVIAYKRKDSTHNKTRLFCFECLQFVCFLRQSSLVVFMKGNIKYSFLFPSDFDVIHQHNDPNIAHICQLRHPRRGCTFFKPVYFFPQGTQKGLLWAKFIQTKYKCNSCYLCDEDNSSKISNAL